MFPFRGPASDPRPLVKQTVGQARSLDGARLTIQTAIRGHFNLPPLPQVYTNPAQVAWCKLATLLFNIDFLDMLMTADEKHESLKNLSAELPMSELHVSLPIHNRTVMAAELMCKGEAPVNSVVLFTALLRCQLETPLGWKEWPITHQYLGPLQYL